MRKTEKVPQSVMITSSKSNNDFEDLTSLLVPYDLVVSGKDYYVYLVTNEEEVHVLEQLHKFNKTKELLLPPLYLAGYPDYGNLLSNLFSS